MKKEYMIGFAEKKASNVSLGLLTVGGIACVVGAAMKLFGEKWAHMADVNVVLEEGIAALAAEENA